MRDARAPHASAHPRAYQLFSGKPRLIILAKKDLADLNRLQHWLSELSAETGQRALALALKQMKGKDKLISLALALTAPRREALAKRGLLPRPMRACVVGMPNTGKSSLINWLIGRRKMLVGDRPGITKGAQWVKLHAQLELLDTPGILPHTALTASTRLKLAMLNLLPEAAYDFEQVASEGLSLIEEIYPGMLADYYDVGGASLTVSDLARVRNCLGPGGSPDTRRAASLFLNDLREGRLGRITLDSPQLAR